MDQENKQPSADTHTANNTDTSTTTGTSASTASGSAPTMTQLMEQSPRLSPLCGWIRCLRGPALSMQYSIQKRHVPDLNADIAQQSSGTPATAGQNSDTMDMTGGFTIRYFDFALGILGLTVVGCLLKCCSRLKKKL